MLVVLALLTAVILGVLLTLLLAAPVGLAAAAVTIGAGVAAQRADGIPRRTIGLVLLTVLLIAGSALSLQAFSVVEAITTTGGEADSPDAVALDSARDKLAGLEGATSFRLELTEAELQAVVQDGIAADPEQPIRRIDLDLRASSSDVAFAAVFKSGSLTATGTADISARDGGVALDLGDLDFGGVRVPGVARGAIASLLSAVTDLNGALASQDTVVQDVEVGDDVLVVIGVRAGVALSGGELLDAIRAQAATGPGSVAAPPEVLGPGRVDALEAPGSPIVLALGDSLAANAGVSTARDGYVSRFHRAVADADGIDYGLRNLGVPGENVSSLLRGGQLDLAEQVLRDRPAAYVTLDIGANDLLVHLQSADCADDLGAPACEGRIAATLESYRDDLGTALDRLTTAGGSARVVLLQFYNPFSLGLGGSEQAVESSTIVARMNAVAADVAGQRGVTVADGFTPMEGTTAATTHMLDAEPDIHPNAAGHDVLATALFRAVGGQV